MANVHEEYKIRGLGITLTIPVSRFDQVYQEVKQIDPRLAYAFNAVRHTVQTSGGDTMNLEFELMSVVIDAARLTVTKSPGENES